MQSWGKFRSPYLIMNILQLEKDDNPGGQDERPLGGKMNGLFSLGKRDMTELHKITHSMK